mgnify:CR=1 FL=1
MNTIKVYTKFETKRHGAWVVLDIEVVIPRSGTPEVTYLITPEGKEGDRPIRHSHMHLVEDLQNGEATIL